MTWGPLILTRERVALLWAQVQSLPAIQAYLGWDTPDALWLALTSPRNLFYDVGPGTALVAVLDVRPGLDATVYFLGFDQHLRGKEPSFRDVLAAVFSLTQLRRMTVHVPASLPVLARLCHRLGFQWEGVLRKGWQGNDGFEDVHVHGLLREDLPAELAAAA